MSMLGKIRIGHKAPHFQCEAVIKGVVQEVSLSTYIQPSIKPGSPNPDAPWLIILFIPAAFSFVCPTEVLAFQNCQDEFKDRNCSVVFISVDTKHSLWHWQNVPRQYGGLGKIDLPLLSDATHRIARDYGVLIEEDGVSLRGMFIIDNEGIVQQITLNNLTVGRSVLEALRLLEAFQAVAKHGVLCPVDWKPSEETAEIRDTISNTLTESYDERLANLQKEFGGIPVTDLDAKHTNSGNQKDAVDKPALDENQPPDVQEAVAIQRTRSRSSPHPMVIHEVSCERPQHTTSSEDRSNGNDCLPRQRISIPEESSSSSSRHSLQRSSAPSSRAPTPAVTPGTSRPTYQRRTTTGTARHSRGTQRPVDHRQLSTLFTQSTASPSLFNTLIRRISSHSTASSTDSSSGHSTTPPTPTAHFPPSSSSTTTPVPTLPPSTPRPKISPSSSHSHPNPFTTHHNTYETRSGSHIVLEFADPTLSQHGSPPLTPSLHGLPPLVHRTQSDKSGLPGKPALSRATSWAGPLAHNISVRREPDLMALSGKGGGNGSGKMALNPTRLQATFDAIKKMSAGLASPRADGGRKGDGKKGLGSVGEGEEDASEGYFDGVVGSSLA